MHIVGASAAIWTTTIVLAFYVNPIMDWFKGGPKKNQNPAASSTLSLLRSGKGMFVAGKTIHNAPENGTSWWEIGLEKGLDLKKQEIHTFEDL